MLQAEWDIEMGNRYWLNQREKLEVGGGWTRLKESLGAALKADEGKFIKVTAEDVIRRNQ